MTEKTTKTAPKKRTRTNKTPEQRVKAQADAAVKALSNLGASLFNSGADQELIGEASVLLNAARELQGKL